MADLRGDAVRLYHPETGNFGSGRLIARNRVLTARHVVKPQTEGWRVERLGSLGDIRQGKVIWLSPAASVDAAVVEITSGAPLDPLWPVQFGDIVDDAAAPIVRGWTCGFPRLAKKGEERLDRWVSGTVQNPSLADPHYELVADSQAWAESGRGEDILRLWKGLSGGALFVGRALVGIMEEVPANLAPGNTLRAVRIKEVARLERFAEAVSANLQMVRVPSHDGMAALSPVSDILYLFDRNQAIADIEQKLMLFAGAKIMEVLVVAGSEDLVDEFDLRLSRDLMRELFDADDRLQPVPWPDAEAGAVEDRFQRLLLSVAKAFPDWPPPMPDMLRQAIVDVVKQDTRHPPVDWFSLRLPPVLQPQDLDLLARWRGFWSEVASSVGTQLKARSSCGYVLRVEREDAGLDFPALPAPPGNIGSLAIRLDAFGAADLDRWPTDLQAIKRLRRCMSEADFPKYRKAAELLKSEIHAQNWTRFHLSELKDFVRNCS